LSNHASGTAVDLNADRHPLGTSPSKTFNKDQIAEIHKILAETGHLVRWGGDYTGRQDPMHFEILDGVTEARCAARLKVLHSDVAKTGSTTMEEINMAVTESWLEGRLDADSSEILAVARHADAVAVNNQTRINNVKAELDAVKNAVAEVKALVQELLAK
jgi:D-alanyl-D-alanine carboxypeptidase-like protein